MQAELRRRKQPCPAEDRVLDPGQHSQGWTNSTENSTERSFLLHRPISASAEQFRSALGWLSVTNWRDLLLRLLERCIDLLRSSWTGSWLSWWFGGGARPLDPALQQALEKFRAVTRDAYDANNAEHEAQLMRLWQSCFPHEPLEARFSKQWQRLGFQGSDPATDFRGGGVFALRNLLYLADVYPHSFRAMATGHNVGSGVPGEAHGLNTYPFAITGINITNLCFEFLGWGMRPGPPRLEVAQLISGSDAETAFHELYCAAFHLFHDEWRRQQATYMQFPHVMQALHVRLNTFLQTHKNIEELRNFNAKQNITLMST
jgi:hypothetical protein